MFFRKVLLVSLTALLLASLLSSCVTSQQDISAIYSRISNNEKQIRDISSQLNISADGVVPGQAEMWAQMQSMRQDLNMALGQMADWDTQSASGDNFVQLRARVMRIEAAVRKMGSVLAIELPELEAPLEPDTLASDGTGGIGEDGGAVFGSAGSGTGATGAMGTAEGTSAGGSSASGTVADSYAAITGVSGAAGQAGAGAAGGVAVSAGSALPVSAAGASSASTGSAPVEAAPMSSENPELATTLYNSGTKAFSERRYKDAVKIFQDFVKTYPSHRLTSNAYFWEGESHYQLKNYSSAILAYQQVIDKFPGSDKLQSAMFKQGVSMYQRGQHDAGKIRLNELIGKYPKSQEAGRAKQFLSSNP